MIDVKSLRGGYGRTMIVSDASFTVDKGTIAAVLGRNGVGKTTLLRLMMGLLPINGGSVHINGHDVTGEAAETRQRHDIAYVSQEQSVHGNLSVLENLAVVQQGVKLSAAMKVARQFLHDEFPTLVDRSHVRASVLSGGQRRLLGLARALLTDPQILLLDEPTLGLQPSLIGDFQERLARIQAERNLTVLLIEQRLDFALDLASEAMLMAKGEIREVLSTAELRSREDLQHEYLGV